MQQSISPTKIEMAQAAAVKAAELLQNAIARNGHATFIAATGTSQFEFLDTLASAPDIDWTRTTILHPASILCQHERVYVFLDAASLLS